MAEKKFFVDINLQGSALTNAKIGTNSGIGSTEGAFGYDSSAHRLQYFDGTATKEVANLSDISAVTGGLILQGGYDADTNTPNITDGTALKGFFWVVTVAGSFLGESVQIGDSIIAKIDEAGATLSDWLILQGNVVIATDTVDGISRLATQTEANDGTEGGAVVITPATLQGKIDAQITPEISNKLPLAGGIMSGNISMNNGHSITNLPEPTADGDAANKLYVDDQVATALPLAGGAMIGDINMGSNSIIYLSAPINGGDAANKIYVDGAASDAQANAEATASADATVKADAAEAAANAYTDTGLATKLDLAGGTMSGNITMGNNNINQVNEITTNQINTSVLATGLQVPVEVWNGLKLNNNSITELPAPTNNGDAANKEYVDTSIAATRLEVSLMGQFVAEDGCYVATILHNLNTPRPASITVYDSNSMIVEMATQVIDNDTIKIYSNFQPSGFGNYVIIAK